MNCLLCEEPFDDASEVAVPVDNGTSLAHQACVIRMVTGGVNHRR